jgi:imidazole glycerol phosphate synthase glutamine amidotransferase subunit
MRSVEVIQMGGGNLGSVMRCLTRLEIPFELTEKPSGNAPVLLPGVGAFGAVMTALNTLNLTERLRALVNSGTPYLGICMGQQILFDASEETPEVAGLGLLPGTVRRFQGSGVKVPQIGWNDIAPQQAGWPTGSVYFVNSFVAHPDDPTITLYTGEYGQPFCAAVRANNITAFQFHPEKSGAFGHELIRRWADALM